MVNGGEGADKFVVYSNQALLKMFGEEGNDEFVVRAFILVANDGVNVGFDETNAPISEYAVNDLKMFLDKPVMDRNAVQTLSRLNRCHARRSTPRWPRRRSASRPRTS